MKDIQQARRRRLEALLEEEGRGSQARLADRLDCNPSFVSQLANGHKPISDELARRIEKAAEVPLGTLDGEISSAEVYAWTDGNDLPDGHVLVPRLDAAVSAGNGNHVDEAPEKGQPQAFRRDWIKARGLDPAYLASLTCKGDSMEPVLPDGASILVNTADRAVRDGKVYVIRYDDEIRTKALYRRPGGGLTIASFNPQYRSIDLNAEEAEWVEVIGRVIWSAAEH